jgi:hypothetical protein
VSRYSKRFTSAVSTLLYFRLSAIYNQVDGNIDASMNKRAKAKDPL